MKKLFSIFAALLFAGSMMAAVGNLYYTFATAQSSSNTGYANTYDVTIDGMNWNVPGNQNNSGFIRIGGGKNTGLDHVDRIITGKTAMGDAIAKIVISHKGISSDKITLHTVTVITASDANFTTDVVETEVTPAALSKSTPGTIDVLPDAGSWPINSYYKIVLNISNSSTSNAGVDLEKISFYSYLDASAPSITASNIDLGLCLTKDGAYTKTVELEVVGANLTDAITYTIDGYNTTATGTLTKDGGTLQVTFSSNDATGDHVNIITLSSGTTTIDVTVTASVLIVSGFGTQTDPFSVEDVVAINNRLPGTEKYWVKGYIVGCAANGGALADTDVATNFALGDAVDQTTNLVPVELPSGAIRTALNIVDNTENKGKLVKVYGQLISYFTFTGVKGTSDYEFITVVEPTYYLKNNWGGGEWTWQQTTKVSDNEYKLENVVFGGTGVNVNTAESDEGSSWIAHESFNGNPIKALDTVTLTYVVSSNSISAILLGSYVAPADPTWTVAGDSEAAFGTAWTPGNTDNDMVKQSDGTFLWEKENITLGAGTISFKVCRDHAWTVAYPASDYNLAISADGIYTITITFDPSTNTVSATATKTGDAVVIPTIAMHGNFTGDWATTENFALAANEETASLTLTLAEGNYEFGMRIGGSGNWTSNGAAFTRTNPSAVVTAGSGNLTLAADVAGDYGFTWTYATQTLAVTFPDAPVAGCDWDNIDFLGDGSPEQTFGSQFKVCKPDNVGVVNIQKPGFADETGIYMTFPSAAFGTFSLAANQYAIQGAGVVFYLSAFSLRETEVTVNCEGNDIVFTVYNAKGVATGIENNAVVEKAVKFIENGQLFIIKNGVKYNAQGAVVR